MLWFPFAFKKKIIIEKKDLSHVRVSAAEAFFSNFVQDWEYKKALYWVLHYFCIKCGISLCFHIHIDVIQPPNEKYPRQFCCCRLFTLNNKNNWLLLFAVYNACLLGDLEILLKSKINLKAEMVFLLNLILKLFKIRVFWKIKKISQQKKLITIYTFYRR